MGVEPKWRAWDPFRKLEDKKYIPQTTKKLQSENMLQNDH